jgi:hypothetical protein
MQYLEKELRRTGDPRKQAFADVIAGIRRSLDSDIPLPSVSTPEKELEIKRFFAEQREALENQGYVIYGLTGQSIKTLRDRGHKFWSTWHKEFPYFEALGSVHSEVAINPNNPFLPNSNNRTLAQQENMVGRFSEVLGKKVKGVKAIIGQAPDYAELAFAHLDATKEYLFGAKQNYNYARTKTPIGSSCVAHVGGFGADDGLVVNYWYRDNGDGYVRAAPLVVPV